jgi:hypothetical protein
VTGEDQLQWEARWARPAAAAAFASVALQVVSGLLQIPAAKDAPGRNDPDRYQRTLVNFKHYAGTILASSLVQVLATTFLAGALYYLFRATRHRRPELPPMVQWLLVIIPILVLIGTVVNWLSVKPAADDFARPDAVARVHEKPKASDRKDAREQCRDEQGTTPASRRAFERRYKSFEQCASKRAAERATARRLIDDHRSVPAAAALFAQTIGLAFAFVMLSLNAMRAGLLSRFMGILGIIVGALTVLPILPQGLPVVQMFWLGALGVLYLGVWPGGRGPAWETGEAIPWPTAADLREAQEEAEPEPDPEPEHLAPSTEHPVSKKRKRKRKR